MLQSLHIVNFAIIEDTWIDLNRGATIFTGETGSGKSILMDALAILLGRRASTDLIRNGEAGFRVEGVFTADSEALSILEDMGLDGDEEEIVIVRKMGRNGRGICTINGTLCTVRQLEKLGKYLVKLHEQNDNAELLSPEFCRYMVDHSDPTVTEALADYTKAYGEWKNILDKLDDFKERKQERERRLDILQWEIDQIEQAGIENADEDEEISTRLNVAENHEKIYVELNQALTLLSMENGVQENLGEVLRRIGSIVRYDPSLSTIESSLQSSLYAVEDAISELENYSENTEFSQEELSALQDRDEVLSQLKAKYGPELKDVLVYLQQAKDEYDRLHEIVYDNDHLKKKFQSLTGEVERLGKRLNVLRKEKGQALCKAITKSLHDMEMEHAVLALHIEEGTNPTSYGAESVEFYFSANPGEPLKPMRQVASGGEISRISLSIEDIMAHYFSCQTLVFDEIDTGISGSAALRVARKIRHLAESVQVLCITHMPQTASIADAHYSIRKTVKDGHTSTRAVLLSQEDHILDIAWMISGNRPPNESAIQSARDLQEAVRKK